MKNRAAAIGTFDGVHRGHGSVLDLLLDISREKDLEPIAITFDRHPLALIAPERTPPIITRLKNKQELLGNKGIQTVVFEFNEEIRCTTAEEWMRKIHDELGVKVLVIGYDTTFGCDGLNLSVADYMKLGEKTGIEIVEAPELKEISSSAIRKAILAGNVEHAAEMLGRPYVMTGKVVHGNSLGHTIGFPTANLEIDHALALPCHGVYSAEAVLPDGTRRKAMVNIGVRPTVRRGDKPVIEAHLIDWQGDLYGKDLKLKFLKRIREEKKFDSIDALKKQLEKDRTICNS